MTRDWILVLLVPLDTFNDDLDRAPSRGLHEVKCGFGFVERETMGDEPPGLDFFGSAIVGKIRG
jgi:hypothetical protein